MPIFKVVFQSLGDTVEYQLKGLLPKERYFRLQPILYYAEEAMDKVDLVNMHHLEKDAEAFSGIPVDGIVTDYVEEVGPVYGE